MATINSIYHLLSTYYVPFTLLSPFCTLPYLIAVLSNLILCEIGMVILILYVRKPTCREKTKKTLGQTTKWNKTEIQLQITWLHAADL